MEQVLEKKSKRKVVVLTALAACLVVACVGGVLAWINAQSSLTNTFTVGNIKPPTTDPTSPDDPIPTDPTKVDGNICEPSWIDQSKIGPGAVVAKDPYIGVGPNSDTAYTYVYVKNNLAGTYFTLNEGWAAVDATSYTGTGAGSGDYTSGLFVYGTAAVPTELKATTDKDAWTAKPLFDNIKTASDATFTTGGDIAVHAYVAAKSNSEDSFTDLETAAKAWAAGLSA